MTGLTRRRFIAISAAATGLAALPARAVDLYQWRGVALGAGASIILAHPDAKAIVARAVAEIGRLETIFNLYRTDSALTALNRDGSLAAPPSRTQPSTSTVLNFHSLPTRCPGMSFFDTQA